MRRHTRKRTMLKKVFLATRNKVTDAYVTSINNQ